MQTKLRTYEISPNNNICFPVGTILTVQKQHEKLGFHNIFSKYKTKGRDLNSLITALVSYKLTDNFSISKASEWINRKKSLNYLNSMNFKKEPSSVFLKPLEKIGKKLLPTFKTVYSRNLISSILTSILTGQA